jgi:hypothetical protein
MNQTIGIKEWRDVSKASLYPFEQEVGIQSLFLDASFAQFDGFIPVLKSVQVNSGNVTFEILFDDGVYKHVQQEVDCVEGAIITFRKNSIDRYYGHVVAGPGILYALNNMQGVILSPSSPFSAITVRSIPSTAGLYNIEQASGNIDIKLDHSMFATIAGNTIGWNAVSMPSNIPEVRLLNKNIYVLTDKKNVLELDLENHKMKVLFTLPMHMDSIATTGGKLYGTKDTVLYDLSAIPPEVIGVIPYEMYALCSDADGNGKLFGLSGNGIYDIDPSDGTSTQITPITSAGYTLACYDDEDKFAMSVTGPFDKNAGQTVADLLYTMDTTLDEYKLLGVMSIAGNIHQPVCAGLVNLSSGVYGVLYDGQNIKVTKVDMVVGTAELLFTVAISEQLGTPWAVTDGKNVRVVLRRIVPLRSVNNIAPVNNALHFVDGGIMHLEKTAPDEVTISFGPDGANTKVQRSTKYEE